MTTEAQALFASSPRLPCNRALVVYSYLRNEAIIRKKPLANTILKPPVCLLCRLVASVAGEGRGNTLRHSTTTVTLAAHARRGLRTRKCNMHTIMYTTQSVKFSLTFLQFPLSISRIQTSLSGLPCLSTPPVISSRGNCWP